MPILQPVPSSAQYCRYWVSSDTKYQYWSNPIVIPTQKMYVANALQCLLENVGRGHLNFTDALYVLLEIA